MASRYHLQTGIELLFTEILPKLLYDLLFDIFQNRNKNILLILKMVKNCSPAPVILDSSDIEVSLKPFCEKSIVAAEE